MEITDTMIEQWYISMILGFSILKFKHFFNSNIINAKGDRMEHKIVIEL